MIPNKLYNLIISNVPVVCVDIMVYNKERKILLLKRSKEPLKNCWWVVGGRVLKDESIMFAVRRKVFEETGLNIKNVKFLGYYEGMYKNGRHSVSVVFRADIKGDRNVMLDNTSLSYKWSKNIPTNLKIIEG